jgi:RHS repeat-associated protein
MTNHWDYGYDALGQLSSAKGFASGGAARGQEQLTYGYDLAGNLQSRANNDMVQSFSVNSLNQLTSVSRTGAFTVAGAATPSATNVTVKANGDGGQVATLYADKTFVRTNVSLLGGNNTFSAEAADALGRKDTNTVTVNLPASVSCTYDLNGNLTSDGYRAFAYDDADQLTAVQVANVWRSEFVYDAFGRRRIRREKVWKNSQWLVAAEVRYVYDGMLVIQERDANNVPTVSYTRGRDFGGERQTAGGIGGLLALTQPSAFSPQHFYYHSDGNGNVTSLLDSHQTVAARYQYDPFGNLLGSSGTMADANLYRFSSKELHQNSGLYYYGYRFYEPNLQRWINADPIEEDGGINLHRFVENRPLGLMDASGLQGLGPGYGCMGWDCGVPGARSCEDFGPPSLVESLIPVYGPMRQAGYDFGQGSWGWGAFNTGIACSDVIPLRSLANAGCRGAWKFGGVSWRRVRGWLGERGWLKPWQDGHHWCIPRNGWGESVPNWLKNQPWNVMAMPDAAFHDALHGIGPLGWTLPERLWHGSPLWFRAALLSTAGREVNSLANDQDSLTPLFAPPFSGVSE